jgi:hypothetical protein
MLHILYRQSVTGKWAVTVVPNAETNNVRSPQDHSIGLKSGSLSLRLRLQYPEVRLYSYAERDVYTLPHPMLMSCLVYLCLRTRKITLAE